MPKFISSAARLGAPVVSSSDLRDRFPSTVNVWPVDEDGHCTCYDSHDCRRPGKHADDNAPDNDAYAVLCGPGGVLVVDVDVKGKVNGFEELKAWDLPPTLEVHTPSGGRHLYYRHPGGMLSNRKLGAAIDVRANARTEYGYAYVIGPGSPGFVKTDDPCTVTPADPYEIAEDEPIADAPALLVSFLSIGAVRNAHDATPMAKDHERYAARLEKGRQWAKDATPSQGDGQGGSSLLRVALRLVRTLELHDEDVHDIIDAEFNPRCTTPNGDPWPWSWADIQHKIDDARYKSDIPCGLSEGIADKMRAHAIPRSLRGADERIAELKERMAKTRAPRGVVAGMTFTGDRTSLTRDQIVHALYLSAEWSGVLWFDVLKRRPFAINPPIDAELALERGSGMSKADRALIAHWFATRGESVQAELIDEAVHVVTAQRDRQKNVIAEYLDSLEPAIDSHVLDTLATDVFGAKDPFANLLLKKTLVAAARRGRTPGYEHKGMLVLKGPQCCGKTPAVKILAGDGRYHSTGNGDITSDWTLLACAGNWLVEVEEMSALKRDVDALKTAISRCTDTPNVKFEPNPQPYPRSFVFIATTNKESFLNDSSGDARYWVIDVGQIDLARLAALRDRIWAESDFLARTMPVRWTYLTKEEEAMLAESQTAYRKVDPFLEPVRAFVASKKVADAAGKKVVDVQLVWDLALGGREKFPTPNEHERIEACLQILKCVKRTRKDQSRPRIDKRRVSTWWEVPDDLDAEPAEPANADRWAKRGPAVGPS